MVHPETEVCVPEQVCDHGRKFLPGEAVPMLPDGHTAEPRGPSLEMDVYSGRNEAAKSCGAGMTWLNRSLAMGNDRIA